MAELLTTADHARHEMLVQVPERPAPRPVSPYLTTAQAALYLGYATRRGLLKAVERGEIAAAGRRGRTFLFVAAELDAMVEGACSCGAPPPGGVSA